MSTGWSLWVICLIVFNMSITLFLFLWGPRAKIPTQPDGTTGHVWAHGVLRESVRDLPRWWVVMSTCLFIIGFTYLALYPGFGNFKGALDWTSQTQLAEQVAANDKRMDEAMLRFASRPPEELAKVAGARSMGKLLFDDNCAACHGLEARGNALLGAPDLTDGDWLYGGDGAAITTSILDGRHGVMPPWGAQFGNDGVENLSNYVLALSGAQHDAGKAEAGKALFTVCAACHGPDGKGNVAIGAPNLTDGVWLYGGTLAAVEDSIRNGRGGTMPAWRARLGEQNARLVSAYVYSLSHGGSDNAR